MYLYQSWHSESKLRASIRRVFPLNNAFSRTPRSPMLSSFLVIQDSEDEGSDNNDHYRENGMVFSPSAALTEPSSHLQSPSLSSEPRQISGGLLVFRGAFFVIL